MNYSLTLSLRTYLEDVLPQVQAVRIIYDTVSLTGTPKPFLTIESLPDTPPEILSAGRRSYSETYNFQIGLYARNIEERYKLEEKVRTILREPIPIYTETGLKADTSFVGDVGAFTPMTLSEGENETNKYRGYFDFSVRILRNTGETEFTQ